MFKFLSSLYVNIWVPVFGRMLSNFIIFLEGKKPSKKPNYKINESSSIGIQKK